MCKDELHPARYALHNVGALRLGLHVPYFWDNSMEDRELKLAQWEDLQDEYGRGGHGVHKVQTVIGREEVRNDHCELDQKYPRCAPRPIYM